MPSFPVLPEREGFLRSGSALVSQPNPFQEIFPWDQLKDPR